MNVQTYVIVKRDVRKGTLTVLGTKDKRGFTKAGAEKAVEALEKSKKLDFYSDEIYWIQELAPWR